MTLATCANCDREAFFAYLVTSSSKILYCSRHLPKFLTGESNKSSVVLIESVTSDAEVLNIKPTTKKKKTVSEEPVIELPVVEEPPVLEDEPVVDEGEQEVDEAK
jgi:hypothetical protein